MRRLFIIRRDLHLSGGKLAAMVGHCCEAYWTNLMKASSIIDNEFELFPCRSPFDRNSPCPYRSTELMEMSKKAFEEGKEEFAIKRWFPRKSYTVSMDIPKDVWDDYVKGIFTKTVCEAKNLAKLMKAKDAALELGLEEGVDFGFINDKCLTELMPENEDGTTTVGIWFRPLPDEIAHSISRKYQLYSD